MRAMPSTSPFLAVPDSMIASVCRLHLDAAAGHGDAPGRRLVAHIHHVRLALRVEMRQGTHGALVTRADNIIYAPFMFL